ncbi:hypothetical protein [Actinomycetospora termitidis]|uniref:Uncharacterized protein n=1 Tax=Actinomycetospora termitidis TaxID=3053470 RepID=A0ABT7MFH5_9PSEU|nr:hypothetical protein [Actinomycetospora sp. Odt1-22]MDL5159414.1 hypothetical protein [Actinomycetospora sp. Odt1-22]
MPHGGEVVEIPPERCPNGCRWGRPVNGVTLFTVGWQPCNCPAVRASAPHGHRLYECCRPGCDGQVLRPPCSAPLSDYAGILTHRPR